MAVLFSKDKITQREHDHPIFSGTFKLDPTASPRHIDVTIEEGPEFKPGVKLFGIYKFDGESLILCFGEPSEKKGSVRPEGFSLPDTKDITMSFKKEQ